eukprot:scaffold1424_cov359-Prasinococcus_capsulatus_cf.AAC.4
MRVVGGARKLGILPLFSGESSCFPRNVASSVLRKRSVNSGALYVSRVGLIASTILSSSSARRRRSQNPCGARPILVARSLVGTQAESRTWVWCGMSLS